MTLYEQMTNAIDSFTTSCIDLERSCGERAEGVRGMIDGALYCRDILTIEAAECVVS